MSIYQYLCNGVEGNRLYMGKAMVFYCLIIRVSAVLFENDVQILGH